MVQDKGLSVSAPWALTRIEQGAYRRGSAAGWSKLRRQFAFDPGCLANGSPVHTTIHDRWRLSVDDKTDEIEPNAFLYPL